MGRALDAPASRARIVAQRYGPLTLLVLAAVAISVIVHHTVFPALSWNRDEAVYLWQVHALADGKMLTSSGGMPLFFQPWLTGIRDQMFFSQYTLGWPLVLLAFETVLGSAAGALAFGSALAVVGTYAFTRTITRDRSTAIVAASLLVLSPLLVIQSGMFLGYLFSLGLGSCFTAAFITGMRRGNWWLFALAGVLVGWLFMTRPFDGLLWALAVLAYGAFAQWHEKRAFLRAVLWTALGFLPLLIATLAYNRHITGSFTEFPITAADPRDSFGFGLRSIGERWPAVDYAPWTGFKSVGRNGWELPPFLFGSYLGVALAIVGLWLRRRDRTTVALLAIAAAFPLGYFFFWGIGLSAGFARVSGPIYLIPMFLPLCVFIATTLTASWRRSPALVVGIGVAMVFATAPFMVDRIDLNHGISEAQEPWRAAHATIPDHSLVIVSRSGPYLLHLDPFSENTADLDGRLLFAADRDFENLDLIAAHPGRTPYLESTNLSLNKTLADPDLPIPTITVAPIVVQRGPVLVVRASVTATGDGPVVAAALRLGATGLVTTLSTTASEGDVFDVEWRIAAPTAPTAGVDALAPEPGGKLTIEAGTGSDVDAAVSGVREQLVYSYRVHDGAVEVLTPGQGLRVRHVGFTLRPRRATRLDELAVEISPPR